MRERKPVTRLPDRDVDRVVRLVTRAGHDARTILLAVAHALNMPGAPELA